MIVSNTSQNTQTPLAQNTPTASVQIEGLRGDAEFECFNKVPTRAIRRIIQTDTVSNKDVTKYTSTTADKLNGVEASRLTDHLNSQLKLAREYDPDYNNKLSNLLRNSFSYVSNVTWYNNMLKGDKDTAENAKNELNTLHNNIKAAGEEYLNPKTLQRFRELEVFNCGEYAFWALSKIYAHNLLNSDYMAYVVCLKESRRLSPGFDQKYYPAFYNSLSDDQKKELYVKDHDHAFVAIKKKNAPDPQYVVDLWLSKVDSTDNTAFIGTVSEYLNFLEPDGEFIKCQVFLQDIKPVGKELDHRGIIVPYK